jgi:hypothetical protein
VSSRIEHNGSSKHIIIITTTIPMKYACLVYLDDESYSAVPDHECTAFGQEIGESGHRLGGESLHPIDTATTVRVRNGSVSVTDGPFAETKELLAGFYLIEARDLNEAIRITSRIPPARVGSIEIRPVRELSPAGAYAAPAATTTSNGG